MLFFSFNRLQKSIKTFFFGKVFFIYFKQELYIFNIFRSKIRLRHLDRLSKNNIKKVVAAVAMRNNHHEICSNLIGFISLSSSSRPLPTRP